MTLVHLRPKRNGLALLGWTGVFSLILTVCIAFSPPSPGCACSCGTGQPAMPVVHDRTYWTGWAVMGVFEIILFGGVAVPVLRAQVIADKIGLRWRGAGRWRSCRWDEVTDYYEKDGNSYRRQLVVETRKGRLSLSPASWGKSLQSLRQSVAQNATRAQTRAWEVQGTRSHDKWPKVFRYNASGNRWAAWLALGMLSYAFMSCTAMAVSTWQRSASDAERWWDAAGDGLWLLLFAPFFWLVLFPLVARRPKLSLCITATLEGLVYEQENQAPQEIAWADVTAFRAVATRQGSLTGTTYEVVTDAGIIDIPMHISEVSLLQAIICRYAVNAAGSDWSLPPDKGLKGTRLSRTNKQVEEEWVYPYRTRITRYIVWFAPFLLLVRTSTSASMIRPLA